MASRHNYGIVREQRKILPYSISTIGGKEALAAWKDLQLKKEEEWQLQKDAKRTAVIKGIEDGSMADRKFKTSAATVVHRTYADKQGRILKNRQSKAAQELADRHRISIFRHLYRRIYYKCLNWFINIKL